MRTTAFLAGALYVLTFASSIPAAAFFLLPVLNDANYIVSSGADARVIMGCLLDVINALAGIGTAVVLFPVVKRQSETLALGFVASRLLEAAVIAIGVVSLLAVVTLRQDFSGATEGKQPRWSLLVSRSSQSAIGRCCWDPASWPQ